MPSASHTAPGMMSCTERSRSSTNPPASRTIRVNLDFTARWLRRRIRGRTTLYCPLMPNPAYGAGHVAEPPTTVAATRRRKEVGRLVAQQLLDRDLALT